MNAFDEIIWEAKCRRANATKQRRFGSDPFGESAARRYVVR